MLANYINGAIKDLQKLIEITKQDIEDIKLAKHQAIFDRIKTKNEIIDAFENKKQLIKEETANLSNVSPTGSLQDALSEEIIDKFTELRETLEQLKELNRHFSICAFSVSEFYNSLIKSIFPHEMADYSGKSKIKTSFIHLEA